MFRLFWHRARRPTLSAAALLLVAGMAAAQELPEIPVPTPPPAAKVAPPPGNAAALGAPTSAPSSTISADDLKARIERLEKQNQDLLDALKGLQNRSVPTAQVAATQDPSAQPVAPQSPNLTPQDVSQIITQYFQQKAVQEKAAEKAKTDEGYKVGTDLRMFGTWKDGIFWETPNKDFYVHLGGEVQFDNLWFNQSPNLFAPKGSTAKTPHQASGDNLGGMGELVDSDDFRRLRLWAEGGFWEVGEFMFQPKLEKIQNGAIGLDEVWFGVKDIPWIGTIRVGHHKTPQGLESDDWSSNRTFTYMERSTMSNAFYQNFGDGIIFMNNIMADQIGQRATYAANFYKPQDGENGAEYADGDYAFTGRLSGLPILQNDGRCLMHLAVSWTYRHNRNGNATVSAQPEMDDFNGGDNGYGAATTATPTISVATKGLPKGSSVTATASQTNVANMNASVNGVLAANGNPNGANNANLVSTGAITSSGESVLGTEFLYIRGPFSVQAEYAFLTFVDSVGAGGNAGDTGNITVNGGYIALSYILTGENRTYDYRWGRLGTNYLVTNTPFWLVRDGQGGFNYGWGAWELEARYSHLDLNSKDINGGETDALNLGVVWHLNNNMRVTFDYLRQNRYDLPVGVNSGWLNGFGIRTQLQF